MVYYIIKEGRQAGPFSLEQLKQQQLSSGTKVWREGLPAWVEARELEELQAFLLTTPPPLSHGTSGQNPPSFDLFQAEPVPEGFLRRLGRNYGWMVGSVCASFLMMIVSFALVAETAEKSYRYSEEYQTGQLLVGLCGLIWLATIILAIIFFCKVQYAFWSVVQDQSTPKPGEAVGFLFVPLFNFYWIFVSFNRLSKELNRKADVSNVPYSTRANEGLSLSYCILFLLSFLPYIGYFTVLISFILFFVVMADHRKMVIAIANAGYR